MENERPSTANTPSRLRPPRARKDVCSLAESAGMGEGRALMGPDDGGGADRSGAQKPRIHSPRSERARLAIALPEAIPAPADPRVKTYRSSATATGRPQPVTKPAGSRPPPRTAAMGRPTVPRGAAYSAAEAIATHSGQRPLWDHKGRLEEMEKVVANLKDRVESTSLVSTSVGRELEEARAKVRTLEEDKEHLQAKLSRKERELEDLGEELQRLQRQQERILADRMLEHQESLARLQAQLQEAVEARERLSLECQSCRRELASVSAECAALKTTLSTQSATILNGEAQFRALQTQKHGLDQRVAEQEGVISTLQEMIAGLQQELHTAGRKLQEGETLRRKLHNTVQELKGNIRVFCRVRPMLNGEGGGGGNDLAASHIDIGLDLERQQEEIRLTQWSESAAGNQISKVYPFTFDKVFGPGATQGDVFGEISQLVQSALDGYRVCIFAYGQTGSGKTFTMEGDAGDLERLGMIPRAVEQIFASTELLREKGWSFGFEASYLEIYNETIRDLLAARAAADAECKYDIRHVDGNTTVSELTVVPVSAPSQILDLLRKAAANRAVAETLCNERSSRSHSVFTLRIRGENGVTTEKIEGLLHLVDLAGSERLGQSGSTGERLKETQAINKSLSSLGDVIHAIANREAHVPYRNSKLTFLLQNSLGGNCKTLMFVNISPAPASLGESLCSLRFAAKVNACQIGTASRKVTK